MSIAPPLTGPVVRTSLADLVYQRILDTILSGALPSGTEIIASDLAEEMQVSPSPVREALLRLAADGLVQNASNRRATVVSFSREDIQGVFEVRRLLECGAAELAATQITDEQLAELRKTAESCSSLFGDPARKREMLDLDNRFHLIIAESAGNESLKAEILRFNRRVRVIQWLRLSPAKMRVAYDEHLVILAALEAHDPQAARQAMSQHIREALLFVLEGLGDGRGARSED